MARAEEIKERIAEALAGFLVSDKAKPEEVVVTVRYAQSTATLRIGERDIERIFEDYSEDPIIKTDDLPY